MHVECLLDKIKSAILLLEKISGKNLTLPILGALLLYAEDSYITIRATNLNIGAEMKIPAKITTPGVVAVPASLLAQVFNGLQGDIPITLTSVNDNLVIQTKNSKMTLKSLSVDDFPTLPRITHGESCVLPGEYFITGVRSVNYAAAISDIKPEIASIFIHVVNKELIFVATDAFRLAEKKITLPKAISLPEVLIPAKNALEIVRLIQDISGELEIMVGENQLSLTHKSLYITSRLTQGNYPNYRQIMPTTFQTEMVLLKSDLQGLIKTLAVFSDKFNQIDLSLHPQEKKCTINSQNQETGEGIFTVEAALSGEPLETRINHRYMSDAIQSISSDSISLSFIESNKPVVMKGVGDASFTYLIMPMNR